MTTYSLLQVSLDQTIDRESLEEASVVIPSVARADCAHLQRDLFGIVVSNLPLEEATAFQAGLKRRGFPTDIVADHELPVLHEAFTVQRIEIGTGALMITDAMGRLQTRLLDELVFVAGGFLTKSTTQSTTGPESGMWSPRPNSSPDSLPQAERRYFQEETRLFRIDLFFWEGPEPAERVGIGGEHDVFPRPPAAFAGHGAIVRGDDGFAGIAAKGAGGCRIEEA